MPVTEIEVDCVRFKEASAEFQRDGLMGWVTFVLNLTIILDGVMVRKTRSGRIAFSFPARRDRNGTDHPFMRPLSPRMREEIESQLLAALPEAIARSREVAR